MEPHLLLGTTNMSERTPTSAINDEIHLTTNETPKLEADE